MSASEKKRNLAMNDESSDSDEASSDNEENQGYQGNEEVQIEFEGRSPIDSDFHGIKQLLQQVFLKAHINLSELTELIIGQNYIGSVVKQSISDEADDEDDDEDDINDVFGITTVINLTERKNLECVQQLRSLLVEYSKESGNERSTAFVEKLMSDESKDVGLVINERFINIPAQISVPLLESLSKEIKKANEKQQAFDFAHFIFICKLYKVESKQKKKKGKPASVEHEIVWSNPEEELIDELADCRLEICVKGESDSALSGNWMEDDASMTPYRRIIFLSADKLETVIAKIKASVST